MLPAPLWERSRPSDCETKQSSFAPELWRSVNRVCPRTLFHYWFLDLLVPLESSAIHAARTSAALSERSNHVQQVASSCSGCDEGVFFFFFSLNDYSCTAPVCLNMNVTNANNFVSSILYLSLSLSHPYVIFALPNLYLSHMPYLIYLLSNTIFMAYLTHLSFMHYLILSMFQLCFILWYLIHSLSTFYLLIYIFIAYL